MNSTQQVQLAELTELELAETGSGILTGSAELGRDIGRTFGAAVGAFLRIGESFYRSGGLTGGNPWT